MKTDPLTRLPKSTTGAGLGGRTRLNLKAGTRSTEMVRRPELTRAVTAGRCLRSGSICIRSWQHVNLT